MNYPEDELLRRIEEHENISRVLDANESWDERRDVVIEYCENHLKELHDLKAYVTLEDPGAPLDNFEIKDQGRPLGEVMDMLSQHITTPGLNPASGGHLGYIPGGGLPVSALGDYIAAVTNKYAGVFYGSPGAVRSENFLINWMIDLVDYPETAFGNLTTGGSLANLIAVICARDAHGMVGAKVEKGVIYLSAHAHHCVKKSLNMAGLKACQLRMLELDEGHHIIPEKLAEQVAKDKADGYEPFLVIGSAGTTDTGVVDPLDAIADISEANNMWFHIDGAYGGFFVLLDDQKDKFKGMERSNSLVLDPHKGLFLPYGNGAVLVRDKNHLIESFDYEANYMQDADLYGHHISPADVSPELTKHFRGLRMWLPLQLHGLDPIKACLREKILLTRYFHMKVEQLGFEVGQTPELSVTTYRYVPPAGDANKFNRMLMKIVRDEGTVFVSSTNIGDNFVLRLAVLSFRSKLYHIQTLLRVLESGVKQLLEERAEFGG